MLVTSFRATAYPSTSVKASFYSIKWEISTSYTSLENSSRVCVYVAQMSCLDDRWGCESCGKLGDSVEVRVDSLSLHTFTHKALDVKVFVLDPERLSFAGLPTVLTGDRSTSSSLLLLLLRLLQRAVDSLLLKHWRQTGRRPFYILLQYWYKVDIRSQTDTDTNLLNFVIDLAGIHQTVQSTFDVIFKFKSLSHKFHLHLHLHSSFLRSTNSTGEWCIIIKYIYNFQIEYTETKT